MPMARPLAAEVASGEKKEWVARLIPSVGYTNPEIVWEAGPSARRVNLDTLTPEDVQSWKPGETVLLNGKMLTGRDAAHKRMVEMLNKGETLPVDLKGRFIYYVGPVDPVGDEVVARQARPPLRGWTNSPARSSIKPACWA